MNDLTVSNIERQNVLNNNFHIPGISEHRDASHGK